MSWALDWHGIEWKSGLLALAVHGLFFLLLMFGLSWRVQDTAPVEAQIWTSLPAVKHVSSPRRPVEEAHRIPPSEPKPAPELQPKPEPLPKLKPVAEARPAPPAPKQADIALEKKHQEALRQRLLQEQQRQQARLMAEQAAQEKQALRKQQREKELKQLQALQSQQNSMVNSALSHDLDAVRQQQAAALESSRLNSLVGKYKQSIADKVRGFVRIPPDIRGNPQALFQVSVLPTGDVTAVVLRRSSGNPAYDQAVRWAIQAASPLPLPSDPRVANQFQPTMEFSFCPIPQDKMACPSP